MRYNAAYEPAMSSRVLRVAIWPRRSQLRYLGSHFPSGPGRPMRISERRSKGCKLSRWPPIVTSVRVVQHFNRLTLVAGLLADPALTTKRSKLLSCRRVCHPSPQLGLNLFSPPLPHTTLSRILHYWFLRRKSDTMTNVPCNTHSSNVPGPLPAISFGGSVAVSRGGNPGASGSWWGTVA
jgi:hypothetical protein